MNNTLGMKIETIASIFTIEKGELKILLEKRKVEPFKGYWELPRRFFEDDMTLEECNQKCISDKIGNIQLDFFQTYTFSDIDVTTNERVIKTSFVGTIDNISVDLKLNELDENEFNWFYVKQLPKLAFDHEKIIDYNIAIIKERITNIDFLKGFFPSDFTLPELQAIYEDILDIEIDRRNFRKKLINMDVIEDTGYKNDVGNGRPAKLYKFKENVKEKNLF